MSSIALHTRGSFGLVQPLRNEHKLKSFSNCKKATSTRELTATPLQRRLVCRAEVSSAGATDTKPEADAEDYSEPTAAKEVEQTVSISVTPAPPPATTKGDGTTILAALLGSGLAGLTAYSLLKLAIMKRASAVEAAIPPIKVKQAAPSALATMAAVFPNAMQEETFMHAVAEELRNFGFRRDNCIALVNTCRDEVCRPIVNLIDQEFGLSFNISGLGGLVNCGKTGFRAAMSHSPEFPCDTDGKLRERYIFFGFPHVSIGETGEVGSLLRRGRGKSSNACGALIAIQNGIAAGDVGGSDPNDREFVTLKKKVLKKLGSGSKTAPDLVQVTKAALGAITDDIERLIALTVDPATADYAVITGVQIHSGNQIPGEPFRLDRTCDYIAPNAMYAVVRGQVHVLHTEIDQISTIKSVPAGKVVVA